MPSFTIFKAANHHLILLLIFVSGIRVDGFQRYMQQYNEVELSALGMAIATVVTVAEILKNNGFAVERKIRTLTIDMRDEPGARPVPKAKIEILLAKTDDFDELMAAEADQREYGEIEEQS